MWRVIDLRDRIVTEFPVCVHLKGREGKGGGGGRGGREGTSRAWAPTASSLTDALPLFAREVKRWRVPLKDASPVEVAAQRHCQRGRAPALASTRKSCFTFGTYISSFVLVHAR